METKKQNKKKILFVVPQAFHNKVGHAGGKTVNYYFNRFKNDDIAELGVAYTSDRDQDFLLMTEQYPGTKIFSAFKTKNILKRAYDGFRFKKLYPFLKRIIPSYYITNGFRGNRIAQILDKAKESNFYPDVIMIEFTDPIFWINKIKEFFPHSATVVICHDITFQSVERAILEKGLKPYFPKFYQKKFRQLELNHLRRADVIVTLSDKDRMLIENEPAVKGKKLHVIVPYYDNIKIDDNTLKSGVIYFGAMKRSENIDAVKWFLENAWKEIDNYFKGSVKFFIVGGGLSKENKSFFEAYNNVEPTGFVADPGPYFNKAICMVVPLRMGAGIKVKVLEAMHSGLPVLTNDVGIEGIPAVAGKDYIHCTAAEDYVNAVVKLQKDDKSHRLISENGKVLVNTYLNLDKSYQQYKNFISSLLNADNR